MWEAAEEPFVALVNSIVAGDEAAVSLAISGSAGLVHARVQRGATRQDASDHWIDAIRHYVYAGDSALHVAAAAHRPELVERLVAAGADVAAANRRGAQPLHYAVDGGPGSPTWDPPRQQATVARLIAAGADPNATDKSGVTPLHRAVRNRCAAAVAALLAGGADAERPNKSGSTPMALATQNTGKSGSGSPAAKAQQAEIRRLLQLHGVPG